jgi:predicted ATP-grasp superfamily ATP-dependent carboligase
VILDEATVACIERRFVGTQIAELAVSHERLRAEAVGLSELIEVMAERIHKQAELLSKRAERPEARSRSNP